MKDGVDAVVWFGARVQSISDTGLLRQPNFSAVNQLNPEKEFPLEHISTTTLIIILIIVVVISILPGPKRNDDPQPLSSAAYGETG